MTGLTEQAAASRVVTRAATHSAAATRRGGGSPKARIPESLLQRLRDDLVARRIAAGIACLEQHRALLDALHPAQKNSAPLLGYFAQWVDIGFGHPRMVKELLARFPQPIRAALPLSDYVHIRMAEGLVAMSEEEFEKAIAEFERVLSFEAEIRDRELVAIANFWIGRCLRRMGRYDVAVGYTIKGKNLALELGFPRMAAVMQVLESWLMFQEAKPQEARRILREAESVLLETDDHVTLGNIQSTYGRIARRQGRYDQALQHFGKSIDEYTRRNPEHPNLARSLANMAFARRLIAMRLSRKIDREAARQAKRRGRPRPSSPKIRERAHLEQLRAEAMADLERAGQIYARYGDHHGLGTVHVDRGLVFLDGGDLDTAAEEAAKAYRLGEEKKDYILEARARILQAAVENGSFEEQIEDKSELSHRAQAAFDLAREAVECARHTQNRRLLARAYLAQASVLANDFFSDPDGASECCDRAAALLNPQGQDYIWEHLQTLRSRLLRTGGVDSTLRQWSHGIVGNRTFQQISEEFAAIVIPKVWKREARKVSRVAARLKISPKKVRRILRRQGLIESRPGGRL